MSHSLYSVIVSQNSELQDAPIHTILYPATFTIKYDNFVTIILYTHYCNAVYSNFHVVTVSTKYFTFVQFVQFNITQILRPQSAPPLYITQR